MAQQLWVQGARDEGWHGGHRSAWAAPATLSKVAALTALCLNELELSALQDPFLAKLSDSCQPWGLEAVLGMGLLGAAPWFGSTGPQTLTELL